MAHLLHFFSTFAPGGPQRRSIVLWAAFGAMHRHTVCAMDGCFDALDYCGSDFDVDTELPPRCHNSVVMVQKLRRLIREQQPELVLTYNWGAIEAVAAARSLNVPVIHHEDGFLPDEINCFKRRRTWARRALLSGAQRVIVPSHGLNKIATGLWCLPDDKVLMIPNGIEAQHYQMRDGAPELRAQLDIPGDAFVVGSVGHLRPEKNPVRLIEMLGALTTPAHLLLVGDGPERGRVLEAARTAGLSKRLGMTGHVADPRRFYRAMDAFVIASDTEQMPVALLEAMATGLPVASTNVGDVARMVPEDGRSLVVEPQAEALAAAVTVLARDAERRQLLGTSGRDRVRTCYSVESMVASYQAAYEAAMTT